MLKVERLTIDLRSLAVFVCVIVGAGCAESRGPSASEQPSAAAPQSSAVAVSTQPEGATTDRYLIEDVYAQARLGPTRDQVLAYNTANDQQMSRCMAEEGLSWTNGGSTLFERETYERRLTLNYFDDEAKIAEFGYFWPELVVARPSEPVVSEEYGVAAERCGAALRELVAEEFAAWGDEPPLDTIDGEVHAAAVAQPEVIAAHSAWKECVTAAGFDPSLLDELPQPDTHSATLAMADSRCRESSGRTQALYDARARELDDWIEAHPTEVRELNDMWARLVAGATRLAET